MELALENEYYAFLEVYSRSKLSLFESKNESNRRKNVYFGKLLITMDCYLHYLTH